MKFLAWLFGTAFVVFTAWSLMILVGIVHAEWLPELPTLGFWSALLLVSIAGVMNFVSSFLLGLAREIGGSR